MMLPRSPDPAPKNLTSICRGLPCAGPTRVRGCVGTGAAPVHASGGHTPVSGDRRRAGHRTHTGGAPVNGDRRRAGHRIHTGSAPVSGCMGGTALCGAILGLWPGLGAEGPSASMSQNPGERPGAREEVDQGQGWKGPQAPGLEGQKRVWSLGSQGGGRPPGLGEEVPSAQHGS